MSNCHFLRCARQTLLFLWLQHLFLNNLRKTQEFLDTMELTELDGYLSWYNLRIYIRTVGYEPSRSQTAPAALN